MKLPFAAFLLLLLLVVIGHCDGEPGGKQVQDDTSKGKKSWFKRLKSNLGKKFKWNRNKKLKAPNYNDQQYTEQLSENTPKEDWTPTNPGRNGPWTHKVQTPTGKGRNSFGTPDSWKPYIAKGRTSQAAPSKEAPDDWKQWIDNGMSGSGTRKGQVPETWDTIKY